MKANVKKGAQKVGKALIALPNTNDFEQKTVMTLMDLALFCKPFIAGRAFIDNCLIDVARDVACHMLMEKFKDADYLFFVDSDNAFPPEVLPVLITNDVDICSGLYFERKPPFRPIAFKRQPDGHYKSYTDIDLDGGLTKVDAVGMGCCLIKRRVIERMFEKQETWWKYPGYGEDIAFCHYAAENGFEVYVDTRCKVEHIGTFAASESFFKSYRNNPNQSATMPKGE